MTLESDATERTPADPPDPTAPADSNELADPNEPADLTDTAGAAAENAAGSTGVSRPSARARFSGGRLGLGVRMLLALIAGLTFALAFAPFGLQWFAPLAPAALVWLCAGVRPGPRKNGKPTRPTVRTATQGAWAGLAFGLGFLGLLLKWIAILGTDAWFALILIESLFYAALGAALALVTRLRWWPLWAAALWVGSEYARAHIPLGGFPWGRVAYGLDDTPLAALASLGGVPFVTFVAVLAGSLLAWAVARHRPRQTAQTAQVERVARVERLGHPRRARVAAVVGALLLAFAGALVPLPSMADTTPDGRTTVAIVQGNVPGKGMEPLGRARTVTRNHLAATQQLEQQIRDHIVPKPDFVLWPENSTDIDPFDDPVTRSVVEQAVRTVGVPILVGAILDGPGPTHRQTAGIVWDPKTGPGQVYAKRHPVPFGEYIPFRDLLLPYIHRLELVGRDTYPGTRPGLMTIGGSHIGLVICFEIAYDEIVGDVAADPRTQLLVVQSNNATYQGLGMADQQFAITRLRAIEYGKATLVATPSGISGVIGPGGQVVAKSPESQRYVHVASVPRRTTPTLAARVGGYPELLLTALGLVALAVAIVRVRRSGTEGERA